MASTAFRTLPAAARRELAELGPQWASDINRHRDAVVRAYSPIVAAADNTAVQVMRDIEYGTHVRQRLDMFVPHAAKSGDARSVVLFVHGGAFIRGSKSSNGHIYDNVCFWFARQGYVAVNMEYRLADDAPYPGGAEDVAAAYDWLAAHADGFGGSLNRIVFVGHSAGGSHVASLLFEPRFASRVRAAGVVLISARLRADVLPNNPNAAGVRAYYGEDASQYEALSPVSHAHRLPELPLMVAVAQYENPYLDAYGAEFFARAAMARTATPRFVQVMGHNHTSIVAHFNSGEDAFPLEIKNFIDNTCISLL